MTPTRFLLVISVSALIVGCHSAKDIYRVARLTFAVTGHFGGDGVQAAITKDSTTEQIYVSMAIRDDYRSAMDSSARLAFTDSVAMFIVHWFGNQRLIGVRLALTGSNSSRGGPQRASTAFLAVFVPEYQPDGSVRVHRLDISRAL